MTNDSACGVEWTVQSWHPPRRERQGIPTVRLDPLSIARGAAPLGYRGIAAPRQVASTTRECVKPPCGGSRFTPMPDFGRAVRAHPPHALRRVLRTVPSYVTKGQS